MPGDDQGPWRRMRLWAAAHAVDDMYQGLVPASVPYFVLDRHYSYVAASGLTLAATLGSSLPQPVIGLLVDKWRLGWMAAVGVSLAGVGAGLSGLAPAYPVVWLLLLASGLGVAMFHPAAGTSARARAGESASAMSIFAAGGSAGFFLAPVLATPALVSIGLGATALFIPPALLIGLLLLRHQQRARAAQRSRTGSLVAAGPAGRNRWAPFLVMTGVEVVRSVVFFGVNTFIELYWIHQLGASRGVAGAALACFLVGGVAGTLLGGRIADRLGLVRALQIGTAAMVPALVSLRLCPGAGLALAAAAASGIAVNIPFAVMIKLGQDYLPSRPGTASGVTLGLGVSIGGLIAPVFGAIAEARGTAAVFTVMCFVPVLALILGALLPDPAAAEGNWVTHRVRKRGVVQIPHRPEHLDAPTEGRSYLLAVTCTSGRLWSPGPTRWFPAGAPTPRATNVSGLAVWPSRRRSASDPSRVKRAASCGGTPGPLPSSLAENPLIEGVSAHNVR